MNYELLLYIFNQLIIATAKVTFFFLQNTTKNKKNFIPDYK